MKKHQNNLIDMLKTMLPACFKTPTHELEDFCQIIKTILAMNISRTSQSSQND